MLNILIQSIPHKEHRYATLGDWYKQGDTLHIRVSDLGNPFYEFLIARHELDEALLCIKRGIDEKKVTKFDIAHPKHDDPGWHPDAPYHKEHIYAEIGERLLCHELGIDWLEYEKAVAKLWKK